MALGDCHISASEFKGLPPGGGSPGFHLDRLVLRTVCQCRAATASTHAFGVAALALVGFLGRLVAFLAIVTLLR